MRNRCSVNTIDLDAYVAAYRKEHPERVEAWRINTYRNYLIRHGYAVIAPTAPAVDADQQREAIG